MARAFYPGRRMGDGHLIKIKSSGAVGLYARG